MLVLFTEYEDQCGTAMLSQAQDMVISWKRPGELLSSNSAVPVRIASTSDTGSLAARASSARLFAGHRSLEWLRACFSSIQQLDVGRPKIPALLSSVCHMPLKAHPFCAGQAATRQLFVGAHPTPSKSRAVNSLPVWQILCEVLCHGSVAAGHCR